MKKLLFLLVYSVLGCGCLFTPQKDNSRFYALGLNRLGPTDGTCNTSKRIVYLDLEEIPAYADISQFVSLKNGCEILRSELLRWGEPLKFGISRSLHASLSDRLKKEYSVVLLPVKFPQSCEFRVNIKIRNFIFNCDKKEISLGATITILKQEKFYAVCDYNNCIKIRSSEPKAIVHGMDWVLDAMSTFISQCLDTTVSNVQGAGPNIAPIRESTSQSEQNVLSNERSSSPKTLDQSPSSVNRARTIELISHGEVYVIVDSEDGKTRYFSGRLYDGSTVNIECDGPFKIISTNNSLIEVR